MARRCLHSISLLLAVLAAMIIDALDVTLFEVREPPRLVVGLGSYRVEVSGIIDVFIQRAAVRYRGSLGEASSSLAAAEENDHEHDNENRNRERQDDQHTTHDELSLPFTVGTRVTAGADTGVFLGARGKTSGTVRTGVRSTGPVWNSITMTSYKHHGVSNHIPVKLPRIFLGAPLKVNGAPGNIQGNLTGVKLPAAVSVLNGSSNPTTNKTCTLISPNLPFVKAIHRWLV